MRTPGGFPFVAAVLGMAFACGRIGFDSQSIAADAETDAISPEECSVPPCLDLSFSVTSIDLGIDVGSSFYGRGLARHMDGYVVLGRTQGPLSLDVLVARLAEDGSTDATFGEAGRVLIDLGTNESPHSIAVGPESRLFASFTSEEFGYAAVLNSSGIPEELFTDGTAPGVSAVNSAPRQNLANSINVGPDGSVFVGGQGFFAGNAIDLAVSKVRPTGGIDASFGTNGLFRKNVSSDEFGASLRLQGGNIVAFGTSYVGGGRGFDAVFQLISEEGVLLLPFSATNPGTLIDTAGDRDSLLNAVEGLAGDVYFVGHATTADRDALVIKAASSDLHLLTDFGLGGVLTRDLGGSDSAKAIAQLPDGRLVIAVNRSTASQSEPILWVLHPDGSESVPPWVMPIGDPSVSRSIEGVIVDELGRVVVLVVESAADGDNIVLARYSL